MVFASRAGNIFVQDASCYKPMRLSPRTTFEFDVNKIHGYLDTQKQCVHPRIIPHACTLEQHLAERCSLMV